MVEVIHSEVPVDRPAFMAILGLLPPYELADVKAAYRDKAPLAHPDRGGNPTDFMHLKEAYEQAVEYVKFNGSRRAWLGAQVETYLHQEEVIAEVLRRGGRVEVEQCTSMEKVWGDGFSLLAERVRHIYVRNMTDGDAFLAFLADHRLPYLVGLDIAGSQISNKGLRLTGNEIMRWLDLSGTNVDYPTLQSLVNHLPSLEWLNVRKTRLGWWGRWKLRRLRSELTVVAEVSRPVEPGNATVEFEDWMSQI